MKRAYLILDPSYSRRWTKSHKKLLEITIAFTLAEFLQEKHLLGKILLVAVKGSNNKTIQKINKKYRGQDKATNILSFENLDWESDLLLEQTLEDTSKLYLLEPLHIRQVSNITEETSPVLDLGNLVLSLEKIEEEAKNFNRDFLEYLAFITIHGTLHLLGFDHKEDEEALIMSNFETKILKRLSGNFSLDKL
jgi:probable rRNA maturation factor